MAVQLKSGCITKTAEGDVAHDVTFTHSGRLLLTVTPKGELVLGEGLSKQAVTQQIGSQLVEPLLDETFGGGAGERRQSERRGLRGQREQELLVVAHVRGI